VLPQTAPPATAPTAIPNREKDQSDEPTPLRTAGRRRSDAAAPLADFERTVLVPDQDDSVLEVDQAFLDHLGETPRARSAAAWPG
jgi:hypothetical protein